MISLSPTNLQLDNATDQARDILNLVITSDVNDYYLALGRKPFIRRQGFCLLYTSPSPRDRTRSRMPSSA